MSDLLTQGWGAQEGGGRRRGRRRRRHRRRSLPSLDHRPYYGHRYYGWPYYSGYYSGYYDPIYGYYPGLPNVPVVVATTEANPDAQGDSNTLGQQVANALPLAILGGGLAYLLTR